MSDDVSYKWYDGDSVIVNQYALEFYLLGVLLWMV